MLHPPVPNAVFRTSLLKVQTYMDVATDRTLNNHFAINNPCGHFQDGVSTFS